MVQAALPIIGAVGSLAGGAASALGSQQKREISRPELPSVALAMSRAQDKKQAKALAQAAREDRLVYFLSQPEVLGLLVTIAGLYASQNIPFSSNKVANEGMQSLATMASVLIGLGYAGVGDLTTLLVAGIAGGVSLFDLAGLPEISDLNIPDVDWIDFIKAINPGSILSDLLCRVT